METRNVYLAGWITLSLSLTVGTHPILSFAAAGRLPEKSPEKTSEKSAQKSLENVNDQANDHAKANEKVGEKANEKASKPHHLSELLNDRNLTALTFESP